MEEKIKITTGGPAKYFLLGMAIFLGIFFVWSLIAIKQFFVPDINILTLIGITMLGWGAVSFLQHGLSSNIVVTDKKFSVNVVEKGDKFFPKVIRTNAYLDNIEVVIFAKAKFFDKLSQREEDKKLSKEIDFYKNLFMIANSKMPIPINMWVAIKHTPLVYILKKDSEHYLADLTMFNKKDIRKIISTLEKKGVKVLVKDF